MGAERCKRNTTESQISVMLLFKKRQPKITTTIPFLDHMLDLLAKHGFFDLTIRQGRHPYRRPHTVEDVGIVLGEALKQALGKKKALGDSEQPGLLSMRPWRR